MATNCLSHSKWRLQQLIIEVLDIFITKHKSSEMLTPSTNKSSFFQVQPQFGWHFHFRGQPHLGEHSNFRGQPQWTNIWNGDCPSKSGCSPKWWRSPKCGCLPKLGYLPKWCCLLKWGYLPKWGCPFKWFL